MVVSLSECPPGGMSGQVVILTLAINILNDIDAMIYAIVLRNSRFLHAIHIKLIFE
jgi:hypothetical protein